MKFKAKFLILTIISSIVFCMGCGRRELSRDMAVSLIKKSKDFDRPLTFSFDMGERCYYGNGLDNRWLDNPLSAERLIAAAGFIDFTEMMGNPNHINCGQLFQYRVINVSLTHAGAIESTKWKHYRDGDHEMFNDVVIATRSYIKVTGIIRDGDSSAHAEVEFGWFPSKIGQQLILFGHPDALDFKKTFTSRVFFSLYDDGWRISGVER